MKNLNPTPETTTTTLKPKKLTYFHKALHKCYPKIIKTQINSPEKNLDLIKTHQTPLPNRPLNITLMILQIKISSQILKIIKSKKILNLHLYHKTLTILIKKTSNLENIIETLQKKNKFFFIY
jgi:hypothetical protein